jgi:hypothetical protein
MNDNFSAIRNLIELFRNGSYSELLTSYWEKPEKEPDLVEFPQHLPPSGWYLARGLEKLYDIKDWYSMAGEGMSSGVHRTSGQKLCYSLRSFEDSHPPASTAL